MFLRKVLPIIISLFSILIFSSCQVVKPYQKNKLNDNDMKLGSRKIDKPAFSFQSYREGSSGANGGKSGGGCGCN